MIALYIKLIGLIVLIFGVCVAAWSQLPIATSQAGAYFIYQNVPGRTALNSPRIVNIPDSAHIFLNAKEIKSDSIASIDTLQGKIFGFTSSGLWVKSNYIGQSQVKGLPDTLKLYLKTAGVTPAFLAAVLGYTPVSASDLSPYATKALMNDSVASVRAAIPTNNTQLTNGAGYINASVLAPYLPIATAAATYQPIGTYATASNTMTFTNKSGNVSQWTNDAGYVTQNNVYAAGTGITKTGSEPNATFSVNQTDVMMASRAADSIAVINDKINGKVPQTRTLQFTAGAGISVSPTGAQDLSANRSWTISATGTSPGTNNASAYSAGTVYTLTATSQKIDFGTTDPVITIPAAGTYLIFTNLKIEYSGLTTILNTCNFKLRRTNNTAADIPNAATNFGVVATLLTGTGGDVDIAPVIYTTSNSNDVIELWGNRQNGISITGSINVGEASIVAVRIY